MSTYSVLGLNEGVVDGDNLDVGVLNSVAEDDTTDAAETVDADLDGSHFAKMSSLLELVSNLDILKGPVEGQLPVEAAPGVAAWPL